MSPERQRPLPALVAVVAVLLVAALAVAWIAGEGPVAWRALIAVVACAVVALGIGLVAAARGSRGNEGAEVMRFRLRERMKELDCIYAAADYCRKVGSVEELLEEIPERIRQAMLSPESCAVSLDWRGRSGGVRLAEERVRDEFVAPLQGANGGTLRVAYSSGERVMPEEKRFLTLVAGLIGQAFVRLETERRGGGAGGCDVSA